MRHTWQKRYKGWSCWKPQVTRDPHHQRTSRQRLTLARMLQCLPQEHLPSPRRLPHFRLLPSSSSPRLLTSTTSLPTSLSLLHLSTTPPPPMTILPYSRAASPLPSSRAPRVTFSENSLPPSG